MEEYKQTDEEDLKEIGLKVIELFKSKNISPIDSLYIINIIQIAFIKTFKKDGEENGNETETIQD